MRDDSVPSDREIELARRLEEGSRTLRVPWVASAVAFVAGTIFYLLLCQATQTDPRFGAFRDVRPTNVNVATSDYGLGRNMSGSAVNP